MSEKREEVRIEPGMKAVVFPDNTIVVWTPNRDGHPTHGHDATKHGKRALIHVSFDVDIRGIVVTYRGSVDAGDKTIQSVVDQLAGHSNETSLIIDTVTDHFDGDMRTYNQKCGRGMCFPQQ